MSISKFSSAWRHVVVSVVTATALTACSKGKADHASVEGSSEHAADHGDHAPAATEQPAKPHGGHDPAHGGLVLMDAERHVEVVLDPTTGAHRVYVSDGARQPLAASTLDAVTLTVAGEQLAMTRAADDQSWEAKGRPTPTTGAKVSIGYAKGGQELARFEDLAIEYVLTGKVPVAPAADPAPAAAAHAHAPPHGGTVETTAGGHIELVVGPSGTFRVWLLDRGLAPRPIAGGTVSIKVVAKGYADVTAAAQGDHFEGVGAPLPGAHATAIVTAVIGGKTETARFDLHLEAPSAAGSRKHQH